MSTPLCMPVATPVSFPTPPSPKMLVVVALSLYLLALLILACILHYFHHQSNPLPYECHISQPLALTNLPPRPHPTLNRSDFIFFQPQEFIPCTPSLSPPPPSSLPMKDSLSTRLTSPANSLSSSYILSPSPRSSTSMPAQTTYLVALASHFTLPSPFSSDQSLNYSTPIPSTTTWRSSLAKSSIQHSNRSTSLSLELNNNTIVDKLGSTPPLLPFPWPFESPHIPHHLLPPQ